MLTKSSRFNSQKLYWSISKTPCATETALCLDYRNYRQRNIEVCLLSIAEVIRFNVTEYLYFRRFMTSIKIKRLSSYITKTDIKEATKDEILKASAIHIQDVQKGCAFIANKIIEAGINHDHTKISLNDKFFDENNKYIGVQVHTEVERHHHIKNQCPDDVTLIDILEFMVDVVMAATARKGRVSDEPISDEILQKAYKNTYEMIKKEIVLEDN